MKQTRLIMGMSITVELADAGLDAQRAQDILDRAFTYFMHVDEVFSTYKSDSEISRINRGEISAANSSDEMREVFALSEEAKRLTRGYFDIQRPDGSLDPSGLVKGWAIKNAADLVRELGCENFFVDAGGDIQTSGKNAHGDEWSVGIRNPCKPEEIIKVIYPRGRGVATSGTYVRGAHIYDPLLKREVDTDVVSLSVIGPDVYEADRFATAAFAMGRAGAAFIETLENFEAYSVDQNGIATMTSGFETYTKVV